MSDLSVCISFPEVELPLKKDGFTSESTTLEALLRGEGVEKKVEAREEESIQEIQVPSAAEGAPRRRHLLPPCHGVLPVTRLPGSLELLN